jgi:type IV secretory pathway TraG/TraD family ATPase VirD4
MLAGLGLHPDDENVWIINPFDSRSASFSLAEAAKQPAMIRYIGKAMIPEDKNSTAPYFDRAARHLAQAVMLALNAVKSGEWTLRDLLCALSSRENIAGITAQHPRARETARQILEDEKHSDAVIATLWTKLSRFEETAALWETAPHKKTFSVEKFLSGPGVLILGNDHVLNESIQPINVLILKMVTDAVLRRPDTREVRDFFVFDEFPTLGKVDFIGKLLSEGRSKGASTLIGTQSVESLIEIYGPHLTNVILGQCAHKMFLHAGSAQTAEWAEKHFGKIRRTETSYSETYQPGMFSPSLQSMSTQYNLQERYLFLSSVFLDLPFPKPGGFYHCINDVPSSECVFVTRRPFNDVLSWLTPPANIPAVERRSDPKEQVLIPWNDEEKRMFFGVSRKVEVKSYLPQRRRKPPDDPNQGNLF